MATIFSRIEALARSGPRSAPTPPGPAVRPGAAPAFRQNVLPRPRRRYQLPLTEADDMTHGSGRIRFIDTGMSVAVGGRAREPGTASGSAAAAATAATAPVPAPMPTVAPVQVAAPTPVAAPAPLAGDWNSNGRLDFADVVGLSGAGRTQEATDLFNRLGTGMAKRQTIRWPRREIVRNGIAAAQVRRIDAFLGHR
jgi:hypothetical protein